MKDPQLRQQMSDFSKRKSSGGLGDPPKKKRASETSSHANKYEPTSEAAAHDKAFRRVEAQYGKTHHVSSSNNQSKGLGTIDIFNKKTGHSLSVRPETDNERYKREEWAKNPPKKQTTKAIVPKAKGVQKVEQKTSSFTIKKGKQLDMDTRKAVAAGKKVNKVKALKKRKADVAKSNADKRSAFEAKQAAKITKRVEAKKLAKENKKAKNK
jgi:hypothetical protein